MYLKASIGHSYGKVRRKYTIEYNFFNWGLDFEKNEFENLYNSILELD